jgi:hydrogenase maturation protease
MEMIIIGVGQSLRGDDGAGSAAVRRWQQSYPQSASLPNLRIELAELPGLSLLEQIIGTGAAIIVDAVHSGTQPGTIHLIPETGLTAFESGSGSAHGLGIAESITLGRCVYPKEMPADIILIGIEASDFRLGAGLSKRVQHSLALAAQSIEEQFQGLLNREIRE